MLKQGFTLLPIQNELLTPENDCPDTIHKAHNRQRIPSSMLVRALNDFVPPVQTPAHQLLISTN